MEPLTGLGYLPGEYELRTKGGQALNLLSSIDPVQGIMRGMSASGRAFDEDLPPEVRKQAAIEAALETAVPAGMMGIGALARQPAKAALLDMLTLTGAPSDVGRVPGSVPRIDRSAPVDEGRRKFLAGVASLPVAAAVAPDILADLGTKAAKGAARVSTNALDGAFANVKLARKTIDELLELKDDVQFSEPEEFRNLPSNNRLLVGTTEENIKLKNSIDEAISDIDQDLRYATLDRGDYVHEALDYLMDDPSLVRGASDETLEGLVDEIDGSVYLRDRMEDPEFGAILREAQDRKLHLLKNEDGTQMYPAIADVVADFARMD